VLGGEVPQLVQKNTHEGRIKISLYDPHGKSGEDLNVVVDERWLIRASKWVWHKKFRPPTMLIVSTNIGGACIEEEDVCMVGTFSYYHWMASKRMEEREGEQENSEGNVGKGYHRGSARRTEFHVNGSEGENNGGGTRV
jgi:hypothetical protein